MRSNRPFPETLKAILEFQDVSLRELVRRGERHADEPRTMGALQPVMHGRAKPSVGLIEFVSAALLIEPETFAEYRMYQARRLFDPSDEEIGFDQALRNLTALEQGAGGEELLPAGLIADRQAGLGNGGDHAASA